MSEVQVPFGENAQETAILLLGAAEELELGAEVVLTTEGLFIVPEEVAKKAKVDYSTEEEDADEDESSKATAKKTAAKKTAASK